MQHYQTSGRPSSGQVRFRSQGKTRPPRPAGGLGPPFVRSIYEIAQPPPLVVAEKSLERWALQSVARMILPGERVKSCLRNVAPYNKRGVFDAVEIVKAVKSETFHYSNLMTCGSVWHCPVCASKISERRRLDLVQGVQNWQAQGGQVLLLTLTVPHYQNDSCQKILNGILDAYRRMTNRQTFKKLSGVVKLAGRVRALEVTYGENGWHVHLHVLLFLGGRVIPEDLQDSILPMWSSAAVAAGLPEPSKFHGVKVDNGDLAAQYVGKWGLEHEMTKGHTKKSKEGYSPFDLLRVACWSISCASGRFLDDDPDKASRLFKEYAVTFKGRRQLVWSAGLRELLHLGEEVTDDEIAQEVEENAARFALIPLEVWRVILQHGKRGQVLDACKHGIDFFQDFIIDIYENSQLLKEEVLQ